MSPLSQLNHTYWYTQSWFLICKTDGSLQHAAFWGLELAGPSVAMEPAKMEMQQLLDFYLKGGTA